MIILHNSRDGNSTAFVNSLAAGHTIIDWYEDEEARLAYKGPSPKIFPSAVLHLSDGTLGLIPNPASIDDCIPDNVKETVPISTGLRFLFAIQNDAMVTGDLGLLFNLSQLLALLQVDLAGISETGDVSTLQSHWQAAITVFGGTWFTSNVQNMILGYAAAYGIPLI